MKRAFIIFYTTLFSLFLIYGLFPVSSAEAKVSGLCANCHTMHNSQNGTSVLITGTGTGWNSSGVLSGGSLQSAPAETLLVTTCVGCHSSTTSSTIINTGGSQIPIVYNTVVPTNPLAGGNFHWVATDDTRGHNVYGISGQDSLTQAPGKTLGSCANSCHTSLAQAPGANNSNRGGCRGCHVFTSHHDDSRLWYRFLKGHNATSAELPIPPSAADTSDYVVGDEDDDWEQETAIDHNWYKGTTTAYSPGAGLQNHQTITAFCSGCHGIFHGPQTNGYGMGSGSPWVRHPTDIALPQGDGSEYAQYIPATNYSTQAPVAWTDPTNTSNRGTPIVMCLSCHRTHGSDQPDMLRWNYSGMIAGTTGASAGTGCFTCHTTKDGS
ncbi:MAG TPA: hypothetical protein ENG83_00355 [Nitrospirae bacterium]|nr:doubled CXXCH motif [bacterium BMS3Abin06]HDH10654.1 hypothetical protein [Nitrospirota bacterium]HDZ01516.1 hypothetical protein [Nitrospirota bacterium]